MKLLRFAFGSILVLLAAAIGSVAGGQLRARLTGESAAGYRLDHEGPDGETLIAVNPVFSNLLPGVLAGLAGKPRPVRAFLAAAATALAVGDRYEESLRATMGEGADPSRPGW